MDQLGLCQKREKEKKKKKKLSGSFHWTNKTKLVVLHLSILSMQKLRSFAKPLVLYCCVGLRFPFQSALSLISAVRVIEGILLEWISNFNRSSVSVGCVSDPKFVVEYFVCKVNRPWNQPRICIVKRWVIVPISFQEIHSFLLGGSQYNVYWLFYNLLRRFGSLTGRHCRMYPEAVHVFDFAF